MRRALVLLVLLVVLTSACALLTSFEGFDEPKARPMDSAVETSPPSVEAGCAHKRWPEPPRSGGTGDIGVRFAAASAITFEPAGKPRPGFDLDERCSCPESQSCIGSKPGEPCDPEAGTDNVAAELFRDIATLLPSGRLDESGLKTALQRGRFGILFRLDGWNGEDEDDVVRLSVLNAFDVVPADAGANLDGTDTWVVDESSLIGGVPVNAAQKAYVSSGILVASFPRLLAKLRVPSQNDRWVLVPITMTSAQLTARIARDGAGFVLTNGEIGGRLPIDSVFEAVASAGGCLDEKNIFAKQIKDNLCFRRDIMLDPAKDSRGERCDAISAGLAFEATAAKIADDAGRPNEYVPCADAGSASCD